MVNRVNKFGLKVDTRLSDFIDNEVLKDIGIDNESFWKKFNNFVTELSLKNKILLEKRMIMLPLLLLFKN